MRVTSNNIGLFLLWPFGGLIAAIKNWRQPWAMNVFWIACIYMGAIQIYHPAGTQLGDGADAGRYVLELQDMYAKVTSFSEISSQFYDGHTNDVFATTLQFLVSRVTDNGHVFFCILAIIFGFFYSRNVWYILNKLPENLSKGLWVLIAALFLVCPIWNINGVRMWTALHIFCYGALPYLIGGNKKKLWWSAVSILVHHSFIFPIVLLGVFIIILKKLHQSDNFLTILFGIYLFSLTIKAINLEVLNNYLQILLPESYEQRIDIYVNENYKETRDAGVTQMSAYVGILATVKFWAKQILVFFAIIKVNKNKEQSKWLVPLLSFSLLFGCFANIASNVPSGGRYLTIVNMFLIPAIMFSIAYLPKINRYAYWQQIAFVLWAVVLLFDFRLGCDFYGYNLIVGNYLTLPLIETNTPLIDFVKMIF